MGAPDLPDGWRPAEREDWRVPDSADRRRIVLRVASVAVLVAAVFGILIWVAAGHYSRGVEALRDGSYSRAIGELSAARILVIPYRDAGSLEQQARRALQDESAAAAAEHELVARVSTPIARAANRLEKDNATEELAAAQAIPAADLRAAKAADEAVLAAAVSLGDELETAARKALSSNEWMRAGRFAGALLVLEPANEAGAALAERARTGEVLSIKLASAQADADDGRWRDALRLALSVTAVRKDFPGAAGLIADARKALAPKPTRAAEPAPAAAPAPADTGGGSSAPTLPPPP